MYSVNTRCLALQVFSVDIMSDQMAYHVHRLQRAAQCVGVPVALASIGPVIAVVFSL